MARVAAYKDEAVKDKLLWALRSGQDLKDSAAIIGHPLNTVRGWLDKDPALRIEVEAAAEDGKKARIDKPVAPDIKTGADRWKKLREDAASFAPGMLGFLFAIDARVSATPGNPPMSEFFREAFAEFYRGNYREFCMCGARGAGKSTNQIKAAANELIFRDRNIPPMDPPWIWPFMSHNMAESAKRFQPFVDTLLAVGFGQSDLITSSREDGRSKIKFVDAKNQRVEVNIFPNTKEACIGGNLAGATHDEELHWQANTKDGTARADDVLEFQAGAFRSDLTRVQIRISALSGMDGPMLRAIKQGSTSLRYVPTLGRFLSLAVDGFVRVAEYMDAHGIAGADRVRAWARSLKAHDPWIPAWVGNPTHDAVDGFRLLHDLLDPERDRVGIWLRENGSCTEPLRAIASGYFSGALVDRGIHAVRVVTRDFDGRFAAIDTGATTNPSGLAIVERVIHEVRLGTSTRERRFQFRPYHLQLWKPAKDGLPLDLRNVVLPEMAGLIHAARCVPVWWSDGWASHDIRLVGAEKGIATEFVSTSTATRDIYEPIYTALRTDPCPIVLSGCEHSEDAAAQWRQVRRDADGKAIVPHQGTEHGELGQVLARALAHAGVGTVPPDDDGPMWRSFGSARDDGCSGRSSH